jgi:SAM-dependent methyltransferase
VILKFGRDNESARLEWLKARLAEIPAGARILDAGAGELRNRQFCSHLEYVSQDFCQYEGQGDGNALQMGSWNTAAIDVVSDISSIPLPDRSFDGIICTEVLEHVPNLLLALDEFARLLKPGGRLIITAPFCSLTHFAPYHFATGFSRYWYETHLGERGFSIEEASSNGGWFDFVAQELWRVRYVGRRYSGSGVAAWAAMAMMLPALLALRILKSLDKGSDELLTFGWQIVATRR